MSPPVRRRPLLHAPRRLLDFVAALLCIWAGLAHTPAGALLRLGVAKVTGTRTSARPHSGQTLYRIAVRSWLPTPVMMKPRPRQKQSVGMSRSQYRQ